MGARGSKPRAHGVGGQFGERKKEKGGGICKKRDYSTTDSLVVPLEFEFCTGFAHTATEIALSLPQTMTFQWQYGQNQYRIRTKTMI